MSDTIICPGCKVEIEITEALTSQIGARIRQEAQAENRKRQEELDRREQQQNEKEQRLQQSVRDVAAEVEKQVAQQRQTIEKDAKKRAQEELALQLTDTQTQLTNAKSKLRDAEQNELKLRNERRQLEEEKERLQLTVAQEVEQKIAQRRKAIEEDVRRNVQEELHLQLTNTQTQLDAARVKLRDAEQNELKLRNERSQLEEEKQRLALDVQRQIDAERQKIKDDARKQLDLERQFTDRQKEEQIASLRTQIDDLKRKAEQGSQQSQGEAMELVLEDQLRAAFPHDLIEPVPKGVHGGDIVQRVRAEGGAECGSILWETKRTRSWQANWLTKLRDDQRNAKADQAVIVSEVLPKEVTGFALLDGIWVAGRPCYMGVATALRLGLIQVAKTARANEGHKEKAELIYDYLTGGEFKHRVQGIVEAFVSLKEEIEDEKRAMMKLWAKREKQLELAMRSTLGMYGDLQGIAGRALPQIQALELPTEGAASS